MGATGIQQIVIPVATCPLCGGECDRLYPVNLGLQDRWLMRCRICKSCVVDTPLKEQAVLEFYESDYFSHQAWQLEKSRLLAHDYVLKAAACGLSGAGLRCLEVGAGYGFFASAWHAAAHAPMDVLEPNRDCQRFINERFPQITLVGSTLEDLPADRRYDLILCFHVVEHVPDPRNFLAALSLHLVPGGRLLILTPNAASCGFLRHGSRWGWSVPSEHCTFLSPFIPESFFHSIGLGVADCRTVRPALVHTPSSILVKLSVSLNRLRAPRSRRYFPITLAAKVVCPVLEFLRPLFRLNSPNAKFLAIERFFHRFRGPSSHDELLLLLAKRSETARPRVAPSS